MTPTYRDPDEVIRDLTAELTATKRQLREVLDAQKAKDAARETIARVASECAPKGEEHGRP